MDSLMLPCILLLLLLIIILIITTGDDSLAFIVTGSYIGFFAYLVYSIFYTNARVTFDGVGYMPRYESDTESDID
jgi:hypothetical protein